MMELQVEKPKEFIFQQHMTSFDQRPSENQRYIAKKNLDPLIKQVLKEVQEFQTSTQNKQKSLGQLKYLIVLVEEKITQHMDRIFPSLAKVYNLDEGIYKKDIQQISEILGVYVSSEFYVPIIIRQTLEDDLQKSSSILTNYLIMLSFLIAHETDLTLGDQFQSLVHFITQIVNSYSENLDVLQGSYEVVNKLIRCSSTNINIYLRQLFEFLIMFTSFPNLDQSYKERVNDSLEHLCKFCGYPSISDLYRNEVSVMFDDIIKSKQYEAWKSRGKEINKFQTIVYGCKEKVGQFIQPVLQIMSYCVQPHQEVEVRMEMLVLLEYILSIGEIQNTLKLYSQQILSNIIIPCMIWKVGKPLIKIRKASVINTIYIIEKHLITPQELYECYPQLIAPLKSCLNDDWAPDLRFASTKLTERLFQSLREILNDDNLRDVYPALLERLDDSQDPIRIEMAHSISEFFKCKNLHLSPSIYEYMVKAILIHLDDHNEKVQKAIFDCLMVAAQIDAHKLLGQIEGAIKHFKYPRMGEELIKYAREQSQYQKIQQE